MSRGKNLQEMEVGTVQSKTAVNSGAKGGDPMKGIPTSAVPGQAIEDLGGPTPENYRADDDSAKLKEPRLSHVSNVVNAKAGKADPMQSVKRPPMRRPKLLKRRPSLRRKSTKLLTKLLSSISKKT